MRRLSLFPSVTQFGGGAVVPLFVGRIVQLEAGAMVQMVVLVSAQLT